MTRYSLTSDQLRGLANLCYQEQGSVAGAKAEASLIANRFELFGAKYSDIYNYARSSGWFSKAGYWMDNGSAPSSVVEGVRDVLVNGNRTLPIYIDEHDCLSDIRSISTGSVRERGDYIPNETIVKNAYGSTWTFYAFPATGSDPFGYTAEAYEKVKGKSAIPKVPDTTKEVTASEIIQRANHYIGYEEKTSAKNLEDFHANVGSNNYQKFQPLANAGNGDEWCQFFVDGVAVEVCGSIKAAQQLLCMPSLNYMTGYTPDGAQGFKDAGRWYTTPEPGDVVYFYSSAKGRIGHVGYVVSVDKATKTFTTTEGNTRADTYHENGGCVAHHTYSYATVGGKNRVNGFGRPRYTKGSGYMFSVKLVQRGSDGPDVKLLQRLLKSMNIKGRDKKALKVDGVCDDNTVYAICVYQARRRKHGVDVGTNGKSDGQCGQKMWTDILGL